MELFYSMLSYPFEENIFLDFHKRILYTPLTMIQNDEDGPLGDELFLSCADDSFSPNYQLHPMNPVSGIPDLPVRSCITIYHYY
jgi:hypothetical protein